MATVENISPLKLHSLEPHISSSQTQLSLPQEEKLSEDAASAPHVHRGHVNSVEQHLGSSVPQRHHLNGEGGV